MRHIKTALLGLALVASPLIFSSGAAATPGGGMKPMGSPNCDRGYFCVWQDVDYNGYKASFQGDDSS